MLLVTVQNLALFLYRKWIRPGKQRGGVGGSYSSPLTGYRFCPTSTTLPDAQRRYTPPLTHLINVGQDVDPPQLRTPGHGVAVSRRRDNQLVVPEEKREKWVTCSYMYTYTYM